MLGRFGQAMRHAEIFGRENDRVARFRASRNSPPYCRFRPAGRARLRAFPSLKGRGGAVSRPFIIFLQGRGRLRGPYRRRREGGRAAAQGRGVRRGLEAPRTWPLRPGAAALRGGGANGRQLSRRSGREAELPAAEGRFISRGKRGSCPPGVVVVRNRPGLSEAPPFWSAS